MARILVILFALLCPAAGAEDALRVIRGREKMRKIALKQMLAREEGDPCFEDVLFDNFVLQC
tara:strand:- start:174 stop:359 length:186 start_codon:yes stop_codon:yes gene_type:complete